MSNLTNLPSSETHPFAPFLPKNARLLMLGTFPPAEKRWCMPWYYPNFTNDMWRIFGLYFFGDKLHFVDNQRKTFHLQSIKEFLTEKGVAIFDTAVEIRRTKGTASDKDLEVIKATDLDTILQALPQCKAVLTAGQLATRLFADHYHIIERPPMGNYVPFSFEGRTLRLYRQPSSSRAYPMKVEQKTAYYATMFNEILR